MAVPIALKCKFHLKSGERIIQDFIMRGMAVPYRTISYLQRLNREPSRLNGNSTLHFIGDNKEGIITVSRF